MSASVLQPGMNTSTGPSPAFPASITCKEMSFATSTMREDRALDSARDNTAPMKIKATESTTGRGSRAIAVRITDEQPDLLLSSATAKFFQRDRVLRLRCLLLSRHHCRLARALCSP